MSLGGLMVFLKISPGKCSTTFRFFLSLPFVHYKRSLRQASIISLYLFHDSNSVPFDDKMNMPRLL